MRGPLTFWRDRIQMVAPGGYQMVRYHVHWNVNRLIYPIGYLSSSEGSIRRLDTTGVIQNHYNLNHMSLIHDMELTTDGDRIVGVGETLARDDPHAASESAIFRKSFTLGLQWSLINPCSLQYEDGRA